MAVWVRVLVRVDVCVVLLVSSGQEKWRVMSCCRFVASRKPPACEDVASANQSNTRPRRSDLDAKQDTGRGKLSRLLHPSPP